MFPLINMIVTKIVKFDTIPQLMKKNYGLKQRKKQNFFLTYTQMPSLFYLLNLTNKTLFRPQSPISLH